MVVTSLGVGNAAVGSAGILAWGIIFWLSTKARRDYQKILLSMAWIAIVCALIVNVIMEESRSTDRWFYLAGFVVSWSFGYFLVRLYQGVKYAEPMKGNFGAYDIWETPKIRELYDTKDASLTSIPGYYGINVPGLHVRKKNE